MSSLPIGWGDRNNQMSEKDLKLGGDAANKFVNKNAYGGAGMPSYKTSDEVKAFYMKQIDQNEHAEKEMPSSVGKDRASLPAGWEHRQRNRQLQAEQFGIFSKKEEPIRATGTDVTALNSTSACSNFGAASSPNCSSHSAEAALVRVASFSLDAMAQALEQNPVKLSQEERETFAKAMQRAMGAISNCR